MTHIEHTYDKGEISVAIYDTASGGSYRFVLHGHHLEVEESVVSEIGGGHRYWRAVSPWYDKLTELERLHVFREVLAEYRERSLGEGGFQLAALGITQSGDIYVSENTEQLSDDFHRQCAEQNMVTISAQRDVYRQRTAGGDVQRRYPRYRDVYLMGGQLPEIPIACPCGNCTDLLAKVMDKDAPVWILPVSAPQAHTGKININDSVAMAEDLKEGEAWKTTIGHLNKDRVLDLSDAAADKQREVFKDILANAETWLETKVHRTIEAPISDEDLVKEMHARVAVTLVDHLDVLARPQGGIAALNLEQRLALAEKHVRWIRSTAIERSDGEWAIGVWGKSPAGKSLPVPEASMMVHLGERLASQGIRRMESMECSPWHIRDGDMRTAPKAAIERAVKNRPKDGSELKLRFHGLTDSLAPGMSFDFTPREIFPSYFTGKKPLQLTGENPPANRISDRELGGTQTQRGERYP